MPNRRRLARERLEYYLVYLILAYRRLILIVGLNILDSSFTMIILEFGGWEVNPIVRAAMDVYGDQFWVWKFLLVSFNLVLLCLHSRFRYVNKEGDPSREARVRSPLCGEISFSASSPTFI